MNDNVTPDQKLIEAIAAVTGGESWEIVQQYFAKLIYDLQAGALEAKTWDQVLEARGFAKGLQFVSNLRQFETGADDAAV